MIRQSQESGIIRGLASNLIPNGVVVLQYADDTIICLEEDIEMAKNLKLLYLYEMMSGLEINFGKSEVVMIHGDDLLFEQYSEYSTAKSDSSLLNILEYQ